MPLIDLQTNFKSLKYGQDRPGGGNSGQPYIQYPLPEVASQQYLDFYQNNKFNLDFPLRGGGVALGDVGPYASQAAKYDKIRIQKFLKDAPRGPIFILKQTALQLSNPKIQVGGQINPDLGVLPFRIFGNLETTRIYNGGANTLAQVAAQGSGFHFDRHGIVPINPPQQKYIYVADDKNNPLTEGGVPKGNRLYTLYQTKILTTDRIKLDSDTVDIGTLNTLGISRNPGLLFQYPGGPSSVGGIGLTTVHKRYTSVISTYRSSPPALLQAQSTALNTPGTPSNFTVQGRTVTGPFGTSLTTTTNTFNITPPPANVTNAVAAPLRLPGNNDNSSVYTPEILYETLIAETRTVSGQDIDTQVYKYDVDPNTAYSYKGGTSTVVVKRVSNTDLNTTEGTTVGTTNTTNFGYALNYNQLRAKSTKNTNASIQPDFRLAIRAAIPGAKNKLAATPGYKGINNIQLRYGLGNPGAVSNKRVTYTDKNGNALDAVNAYDVKAPQKADTVTSPKDLITFRFDTVEVDSLESSPIVFRAFLSSLQDNHSADYSPFKYVGRGENFYAYNGFTRAISFNFKVAPQTRMEMKPLYRKLNYLASQLYPDYDTFNKNTGFMRAPLTKLTIGDYVVSQPGFLTSINITVPDESPWEIKAGYSGTGTENDVYQLPHVLEVSCQFTPIHNFLPRRSYFGGDGVAHITPLITPNTRDNIFQIGK